MKTNIFCKDNWFVVAIIITVAIIMITATGLSVVNADENVNLNIPAGDDEWKVNDAGFSVQLPQGFFGPDSEPFKGIVICETEDNPIPDTIIKRLGDINLPPSPSQDTIPIEIVELQLVSCQPIVVNNNGDQQLWDVQVNLSPTMHQPGQMTIRREHKDGGTFDAQLPVQPLFIFTQVGGNGIITEPGIGEGQQQFENGSDLIDEQQQVIFEPIFDFNVLGASWFVCPGTDLTPQPTFCPDEAIFNDNNSWLNLLPIQPITIDDEPSEKNAFIIQADQHANICAKEKANKNSAFNEGANPNEKAKEKANKNSAVSADPTPQLTCLPQGTKCTLMQSSKDGTLKWFQFQCIAPDGSIYYQTDREFDLLDGGTEKTTTLTKFLGETADKCTAYYAVLDPKTCKVIRYQSYNRCGSSSQSLMCALK